MNGRSALAHDDSAHGPASEPLLHSQHSKDEDEEPKRLSLRSLRSVHDYFAKKKTTPDYMLFLALVFGVSSGIVAFVYDTYFEAILKLVWEVTHQQFVYPLQQLYFANCTHCFSTREAVSGFYE